MKQQNEPHKRIRRQNDQLWKPSHVVTLERENSRKVNNGITVVEKSVMTKPEKAHRLTLYQQSALHELVFVLHCGRKILWNTSDDYQWWISILISFFESHVLQINLHAPYKGKISKNQKAKQSEVETKLVEKSINWMFKRSNKRSNAQLNVQTLDQTFKRLKSKTME